MDTGTTIAVIAAASLIAFLVGLFIGAWQGHADALDRRDAEFSEADAIGDAVLPPGVPWQGG